MGKVAFVTGANGMTGGGVLEYLSSSTTADEWSKIIITSRSPVEYTPDDSRIQFVALDFSQSPESLIPQMREVCAEVTHAYFSSYVHKDDFVELNKANAALFENFLSALTPTAPKLENVTLQTGGKYYDVHLSPARHPVYEDEPRKGDSASNFYFPQEDFLASHAESTNAKWKWNVIRPQAVIGATHKPNGMNIALGIAVYILTCKSLGVEAAMPTNQRYWSGYEDCAWMPLIAEFTVFVSAHPKTCANQAFNINNGDNFCWRYMWPRLCAFLGAKGDENQKFPKTGWPEEGVPTLEMSTVEIMGRKESKEAWDKLCEDTGCEKAKDTYNWCGWMVQDWVFQRSWTSTESITKARKAGWTGYLDSFESYTKTFEKFRELGQIPSW